MHCELSVKALSQVLARQRSIPPTCGGAASRPLRRSSKSAMGHPVAECPFPGRNAIRTDFLAQIDRIGFSGDFRCRSLILVDFGLIFCIKLSALLPERYRKRPKSLLYRDCRHFLYLYQFSLINDLCQRDISLSYRGTENGANPYYIGIDAKFCTSQ